MAGENRKKTRGRQKIEMKKIEKDEDKLITFSKRRSGINKIVSKLITLTRAEIAFLVFSPGGRPFSFANPSMEAIINRFLEIQGESGDTTHPLVEAHRKRRIGELSQQHNELLDQLEMETKREKELKQKTGGVDVENGWWSTPIEELNLQQLQEMEATLRITQTGLITNFQERTSDGFHASSSSSAQPQPESQRQVEGNPQSFCEQRPPYMHNAFPFDLNLMEGNVDGVHASAPSTQVQVQAQAQPQPQPPPQPFKDQPPSYMFNSFSYDPNLPPNYDNWSGKM